MDEGKFNFREKFYLNNIEGKIELENNYFVVLDEICDLVNDYVIGSLIFKL